jgi:hypothetical protein
MNLKFLWVFGFEIFWSKKFLNSQNSTKFFAFFKLSQIPKTSRVFSKNFEPPHFLLSLNRVPFSDSLFSALVADPLLRSPTKFAKPNQPQMLPRPFVSEICVPSISYLRVHYCSMSYAYLCCFTESSGIWSLISGCFGILVEIFS